MPTKKKPQKRNPQITQIEEDAIREATQSAGFSSLSLAAQALVAYKYIRHASALRAMAPIYGRNPMFMAKAVLNWPQHFEPENAEALAPDFFGALFAAARLPVIQANLMEQRILAESLQSWQVNQLIRQDNTKKRAELKAQWNMFWLHKAALSVERVDAELTMLHIAIETPAGDTKVKLEALNGGDVDIRIHKYSKPGRGPDFPKKEPKPKQHKPFYAPKAPQWNKGQKRKARVQPYPHEGGDAAPEHDSSQVGGESGPQLAASVPGDGGREGD